ncbi:MAG: GumC family protein, partial [Desulfosarcina sp.]|nr:GumC family protein [Desulfobacterales bacterium]
MKNPVNDLKHSIQPYDHGAAGRNDLPSMEIRPAVPEWEQEEIHLRDYLEVIIRRKWMIASFLVLTFITTLILTLAQSKRYESYATLEINQNEQNITNFEDLLADTSRWFSERYYETQVSLITNQTLLERVIDRLDLAAHPLIRESVLETSDPGMRRQFKQWVENTLKAMIPAGKPPAWNKDPLYTGEIETRDMLIEYLEEGLEVSSSRTSSLVSVSFLSEDPRLSREVVDTLCEEFINWKMEQKLEASQRAQVFLMKQIDRAKINLEKPEEAMNRFPKQAGIVSMEGKLNSVYLELEELNVAMAESETDLIGTEAAYHQVLKDGPSSLPQVMANPMIAELKAEYARLQSEYEQLSITFQDSYPTVQSTRARMQTIAGRIQAEEQKIFLGLKNEYLIAKDKVKRIRTRVKVQKQKALDLNERATQYKIMAREVETNKSIYESLLGRSREIESMVGVSSSNISIVKKASIPFLPAKPNVKLNLLLAIAVGLFGGIGLAFFLEYFTDAVTNPDEISDRFQIP